MFRLLRGATSRSLAQQAIRSISRTSRLNCKYESNLHKVNNVEKRFLVWTGKFKKIEDVPTFVQGDIVEKARNRMRIRIANCMMAVTMIGCFLMALSGKRAHERGESVQQQTLDRHRLLKEEYLKEAQELKNQQAK
ncbi:PREDICTED: UPF0389 protein CG9231 [Nicrophorus vespilloides]|uniref:UPF0389 protein CG9231 n=1 Tax=Nicrophorus vespilloides TaxID=110193 RepID=A0ABM1M8E1_NICVS|nr:PREDICTED: UPF0389 protein CG9231 [Nicrophorus vespilloides]